MSFFVPVARKAVIVPFIFSTLLAIITLTSAPTYIAGLGDSIMRGDMLPTCTAAQGGPCPENFFDVTLRNRGAGYLSYDFGLDGRAAGGPSPREGVIGEELPRYCNAKVPGTTAKARFAYTVINDGDNDVHLWEKGYFGRMTLQQVSMYYRQMVADIRASNCHPETKLIMVSIRDLGFSCRYSTTTESALLNEYNGYIRQVVAATPNARYMDTWGPHSNPDGTGVPIHTPTFPWYYGSNMYGVVDGVQTGGNCVHPGIVGHRILGRSLTALMWPFP